MGLPNSSYVYCYFPTKTRRVACRRLKRHYQENKELDIDDRKSQMDGTKKQERKEKKVVEKEDI